MIDMISKGRLVSGFVRGGGQEQLATGVNPAFNRERFVEAHDLIAEDLDRARTVPLGRHALPAPRGQSLGGAAAEAVSAGLDSRRAVEGNDHLDGAAALSVHRAEHLDRAAKTRSGRLYDKAAAEVGYTAGPENFGYLIRVHVQDTEEKALENARQFMWMQGEFTGLAHPVWANPAGYFSPSQRQMFVKMVAGRPNPRGPRVTRRRSSSRWPNSASSAARPRP